MPWLPRTRKRLHQNQPPRLIQLLPHPCPRRLRHSRFRHRPPRLALDLITPHPTHIPHGPRRHHSSARTGNHRATRIIIAQTLLQPPQPIEEAHRTQPQIPRRFQARRHPHPPVGVVIGRLALRILPNRPNHRRELWRGNVSMTDSPVITPDRASLNFTLLRTGVRSRSSDIANISTVTTKSGGEAKTSTPDFG